MMFGLYDDMEAFEDDLYCEESSSETNIDSEVEFHLYSQIHYAQNLEEVSAKAITKEAGSEVKMSSVNIQDQKNNIIVSEKNVIQISDSPDIITLSDTPDEDSIYKSKLQKRIPLSSAKESAGNIPVSLSPKSARWYSQMNLNSESLRKKKRIKRKSISFRHDGTCMIQKILVIEKSSSDENCEDVRSIASESDNVESWMLLGGDRDDKDDNILLNLEGCRTSASEGEGGEGWSINDKDLEAQIGNYVTARHINRYYMPDKNVTCRNCDKRGHLSKNCPTPKKIPPCCLCAQKDHLQNRCPERFCLNCYLPGHCFKECLERMYWKKHCNRCDMRGHYADACPEIWRQYHLTTKPGPLKKARRDLEHSSPAYCYNCAEKGHYGYECSEKRMSQGIFPTFPFIYYYDDEYDIERNSQRAEKKVQELQDAGLLPMAVERPQGNSVQKVHDQKKKRKRLKEQEKGSDGHHKRLKSEADTLKRRKRKKTGHGNHNTERNFPRCGHMDTLKMNRRTSTHHSFGLPTNGGKDEILQISLKAMKKKVKKKKQRNYTSNTPTRDESLFLIKQRKKKPKPKMNC